MLELVLIGTIGRPHGLRGALFVSGRDDCIPMAYREVWVGPAASQAKPMRLLQSFKQAGRPAVLLESINDRTLAEALIGMSIFVERARLDLVRAPGDLFYDDLTQATVFDCVGEILGHVRGVYENGATAIAEVIDVAGSQALDIPLVSAYVDFARSERGRLVLVVAREVFAESWYPCGTTP